MATNRKPTTLDPMAEFALPGKSNEELIAEQEALDEKRAREGYPRVSLGADPLDKAIASRLDASDELIDPWSAIDPMEATVAPYKEPGKAYKFLSPRVCDVLGTRGYEMVLDANGNQVKMGNMMLGSIPQRIADARQAKAQKESNERVKDMQDEYTQNVDRLKRDAQGMGLRVLEPGELVPGRNN